MSPESHNPEVTVRKESLAGDDVLVIHDFLSPAECEEYIRLTERVGYSPAPITTESGPVMAPEIRNNDRVMVDDHARADALWQRLKPLVPDPLDGCPAVGLNERLRFYRYDPDDTFRPHVDGHFARNDERSKLTVLIYLSGGCIGGETILYFFDGDHPEIPEGTEFRVAPAPGKVLIFRHELLHEGAIVLEGRKYVLRTDVMYRCL